MLAEERFDEILKYVNQEGSITVQKLIEYTNASESTIRRDLNTLDKRGLLVKVHGGALALEHNAALKDSMVNVREELNREEKRKIAEYAASLISPEDVVYLDAGTTTGYLIDFLKTKGIIFVTNAVMHARKLVEKGYTVYLPGGQMKAVTEALIGEDTIESIRKFHFTKGFFGTNGIDVEAGFTTPDIREANVKRYACAQCKEIYIMSDSSKFGTISPVTFLPFEKANVLTAGEVGSAYEIYKNIIFI